MKIYYYKTDQYKEFPESDGKKDVNEYYKSLGFTDVYSMLDPNFYSVESIEFVELIYYGNPSTGECILSLWDTHRCLFEFLCCNPSQELKCLKELLKISQMRCSIERNLKYLYEKVQDETRK